MRLLNSGLRTFLELSSARAYKRFYPAVDPLISWFELVKTPGRTSAPTPAPKP